MAQNIPLTFRMSPLPAVDMTPQQFADAMIARLTAESTNTISFFSSGTVAPTSNTGPWLKNNTTWYVWSDSLGAYIPQVLEAASLEYIAQAAPGPDQNAYILWIQLDATGKAQSMQYYSGGAWKDIYEDKFVQITTDTTAAITASETAITAAYTAAIAAAVANIPKKYPVSAYSGSQTIDIDNVYHEVELVAGLDPDLVFNNVSHRYVVPVTGLYRISCYTQGQNCTGVKSDLELWQLAEVNGAGFAQVKLSTDKAPVNQTWLGTYSAIVSLTTGDTVSVSAKAGDGVGGTKIDVTVNFAIDFIQAS